MDLDASAEEMLVEGRAVIGELFSQGEEEAWCISYPSSDFALRQPPPSAKTYSILNFGMLSLNAQATVKQVIQHTAEGVNSIFSTPEVLLNTEFWRAHLNSLWFELGCGLRMCRGTGERSGTIY